MEVFNYMNSIGFKNDDICNSIMDLTSYISWDCRRSRGVSEKDYNDDLMKKIIFQFNFCYFLLTLTMRHSRPYDSIVELSTREIPTIVVKEGPPHEHERLVTVQIGGISKHVYECFIEGYSDLFIGEVRHEYPEPEAEVKPDRGRDVNRFRDRYYKKCLEVQREENKLQGQALCFDIELRHFYFVKYLSYYIIMDFERRAVNMRAEYLPFRLREDSHHGQHEFVFDDRKEFLDKRDVFVVPSYDGVNPPNKYIQLAIAVSRGVEMTRIQSFNNTYSLDVFCFEGLPKSFWMQILEDKDDDEQKRTGKVERGRYFSHYTTQEKEEAIINRVATFYRDRVKSIMYDFVNYCR